MNILFVTQFFYPENFRINDMALRLTQRGHTVTVLTGMPNYPQGEFYKGYSYFSPQKENWQGVNIIRVPVVPRHSSAAWLCVNYLSFIISAGLKAHELRNKAFDVIYAFGTSPITQVIPAIILRKETKTGVIVNVQDLWPNNVTAITGVRNPILIRLLDVMVDYIYNRCDIIMGTSRSFVKAIKHRRGLRNKNKVVYYPQYAVVEKSEKYRHDLMPEKAFHIAFTGNIGEGQGLENLVKAVVILKKKGYLGKVIFELIGDGRAREALEKEVSEKGLSGMIRFHGSFPEEEIPAILHTADAALLILKYDPIFKRTIPAKLQTYLACGCVVLGCIEGEGKALIRKNHIGVSADCINYVALANATVRLLSLKEEELIKMRENALKLSEEEFSCEMLIERLEKYMKILSKRKKKGKIC